ncbi:MAG: ABC transporter permease [Treponema sp.]|jgi:ribose/xylose/arabinose/galactoside ABC-type transport system permease subunit|nr:ABC transporter permease [Treponema sp.]
MSGISAATIIKKHILGNSDFVLFVIFIVVFVVGSVLVPQMLQVINITNVIRNASIVGIVAMGATFVLLTGEVDLSVGSILSLSAVFGGIFLGSINPVLCFIFSLLLGGVLGLINGLLVSKGKITSLMVTLGIMSVYGGLALIINRSRSIYLYEVTLYQWLCKGSILGIPFPTVLFLVLTLIFAYIMNNTALGRQTYYVGANQTAAVFSGVKADNIKIIMYVISGSCAALAGPILSAQTNRITPNVGTGYELSAIAIAVLGGNSLDGGQGSILGTFIAAMVYSFLLNILTLSGIGTYMEQVLKGFLLIVIVAVFSRSLISKR